MFANSKMKKTLNDSNSLVDDNDDDDDDNGLRFVEKETKEDIYNVCGRVLQKMEKKNKKKLFT